MTITNNSNSEARGGIVINIIKAGLLAGTLDILTFTSKGLQQASGLLVHFAITFGWTILFFILYPRLQMLRINKFIAAVVYGIFVWAMMNVVILPLWNHKSFVFNPESSPINALILIVAIGLPLSYIAHRHYSKK